MPGTADPRVLIVDDLETNRNLFYRQLSRRGFRPELATDGEEALKMIGRKKYDIVLLDIMMPGLNGVDVLKAIRAEHDPASLPVIMVTARGESEGIVAAFNMGANDYVTKPVDMPVLIARIETQLERKSARQG